MQENTSMDMVSRTKAVNPTACCIMRTCNIMNVTFALFSNSYGTVKYIGMHHMFMKKPLATFFMIIIFQLLLIFFLPTYIQVTHCGFSSFQLLFTAQRRDGVNM